MRWQKKTSWTGSRQSSRNLFNLSAMISDDSEKRLNQWLRFLFVLGGFVAFLGGVSFAHILALLSLAVPF
jgi:hypothetical protein